jgi:hypothetical protein
MTTDLHAQIPGAVRTGLTVLSVCGVTGLLLTFWLGFEEPNSLLLWASAAMTLAAPLGPVVHLWRTRTLTVESKRVWWNEFASAQVWSALSEYLSSPDLASSAGRRALESQARRALRKA